MKKIIRLTESDLTRIVRRVLSEQVPDAEGIKVLQDLGSKYFNFDKSYFQKNPEGVIYMKPNNPSVRILKINDKNLNDVKFQFDNFWMEQGEDFGRGFDSGNGVFNYSYDGSQINITAGTGNNPENCRPEFCYFKSKK